LHVVIIEKEIERLISCLMKMKCIDWEVWKVNDGNDICGKSRGSFADDQTKQKYPIVKDAAKCAMFKVR